MSLAARAVLILALAVAMVAGYWAIYNQGARAGRAEVQQTWDAANSVRAANTTRRMAEAREREQAMLAEATKLLKERQIENARADAAHAAELDRLRNRPDVRADDRPGGAADPSTTGVGCTGAGLARPDGEFLAGYAADARKLAIEFARCRALYDEPLK